MVKLSKKYKINLTGLLYNNDKEILKYLLKKDNNKYKKYDKEPISGILNVFTLIYKSDDFIDHVKKKLILHLIEKLKYKKTCIYCFEKNDENEIISYEDTKPESIGVEVQRSSVMDEDIYSFLEEEEDDLFDDEEDVELNLNMEGGSPKPKKVIFCCNNCMKVYDKYDQVLDIHNKKSISEYKNFFPMLDSFYMWVENLKNEGIDKQISHSLINKHYKDMMELTVGDKVFINPYDYIDEVNINFLNINKENRDSDIIKFLKLYKNDNNRYYRKIIDNSMKLLEDFYEVEQNEFNKTIKTVFEFETINVSYFPEMCLYYKNKKFDCIDLYSKLYFPYINFKTFYINFILHENKDKNYFYSCYKNEEIEFIDNLYTIEKDVIPWLNKTILYDNIIDSFEKVKLKKEYDIYTTKIFYDFNNLETNVQDSALIFSNIYHLFEVTEKHPYLNTFLANESKILEKIYKPLEEEIKKNNWSLQNKNIIQFKVLLPKEIKQSNGKEQKENYYFQVNIYENMKIEVTISLNLASNIFVSRDYINNYIQIEVYNLIEKLNKLNIFKLNYDNIPLYNPTINSINFYYKIPAKYNFTHLQEQLNVVQQCLYPYFIKDFDTSVKTYRYIRIKNIEESNLLDKFIYNLYQELETFIEDHKTIENEIIKGIGKYFHISDLKSKYIFKNYTTRYKNFNIKPPNFGIFFNITEPEIWQNNSIKLSGLGIRSFDDLKKFRNFLSKIYYIIEKFSDNEEIKDKNIKNLYDLCSVNKISTKKKLNTDEIMLLQQEQLNCKINLNTLSEKIISTDDKTTRKEYNKIKLQLTKRIKKLDKDIVNKKKTMKKNKSKGYFRYLSRLQQNFPNLIIDKCDNDGQYSKQCQKKRQPMGTGDGFQPEIIDFDYLVEKAKLEEYSSIECKIEGNQMGGGKKKYLDTSDFEKKNIYGSWGIENKPNVYDKILNIDECFKSKDDSYKIKDLKIIGNLYNINVRKINRNDICNFIKNIENKKNISRMYKELYKTGIFTEEEKEKLEYVIAMRFSRFFYYMKDEYTESELKTFYKELKINNKKYTNEVFKNEILKILKDYDKKKNLLVNFLGLDHLKILIEEEKIIKTRIIYEIYHMFLKWNVNEKRSFYDSLLLNEDKNIDDFFDLFKKINMTYQQTTEYTKISELTFKDFIDKTEMLVRTDDLGNIVQSVLKYNNKSLSCPNFDDDKMNTMVGFLDIPINQIPENMNDTKIRNNFCQPCCFSSKKIDENGNTTLPVNYTKNVMFCTGKITYEEYKNILKNESKGSDYISTNNSLNNEGQYGILPTELNNLFNNFNNIYNILNKNKIDNVFMNNFKNNLLKTPGFVLQGVKQQNSFLSNILFTTKYTKEQLIQEIKNNLTDNIFYTLNQGELYIQFKTKSNYIEHLEENINIKPFLIIDILSRKNILSRYPKGLNIFILWDEENDIKIQEYKYLIAKNYLDKEKHHIYLYHYKNTNNYEPIILKFHSKHNSNINLFTREKYDINKKVFDNKKIVILKTLYDFMFKWYEYLFSNNEDNIYNIINYLDKDKIEGQIIDKFKKVLFLVYVEDKEKYLIPVEPTGYDVNIKILNNNNENITQYLKTFIQTLDKTILFMKKLNDTDKNLKKYLFNKYVVENNVVIGIELKNGLIVQVKKEKIKKDLKKSLISSKRFYFNINDILFENKIKQKKVEDIVEDYDIELFIRFKLELSNYIYKNSKYGTEILKINEEKNNILKNKNKLNSLDKLEKQIKNILYEIYDKIIFDIDEIDYISFKDSVNNIRIPCAETKQNKKNPFCIKDGKKNKLGIPKFKKDIFINVLSNNLLLNSSFLQVFINNKINIVVDKNLFVDDEKTTYNKKELIF